jgi:hypothetical protein
MVLGFLSIAGATAMDDTQGMMQAGTAGIIFQIRIKKMYCWFRALVPCQSKRFFH